MRRLTLLIFCGVIDAVFGAYSAAGESSIRTSTVLASGYDPVSRPNDTTEVKVGVTVLNIEEWDRRKQIFSFTAWITAEWTDARLTWNPATKGGIQSVFSPPDLIWKPDIAVDNVGEDINAITEAVSNLRYDYTGRVVWQSKGYFRVNCQIEVIYMINEKQQCRLEVVGWKYNKTEVSVGFQDTATNTEFFSTDNEWKITDTKTVSAELGQTLDDGTVLKFPKLEFWFHIERKNSENGAFFFAVGMTAFLIVFTFLIPTDSGERLTYIVSLYLSLIVLLTIIYDRVPSAFVKASGLNTYITLLMALSGQGIFFTTMLIHSNHHGMKSLLSTLCGLCCCFQCIRDCETDGFRPESDKENRAKKVHISEKVYFCIFLIQIVFIIFFMTLQLQGDYTPSTNE